MPSRHRRPTAITVSPARARPKRPPPRGRVRQDPIPTQARASVAGATALANKASIVLLRLQGPPCLQHLPCRAVRAASEMCMP
jgi:hypothetical protein